MPKFVDRPMDQKTWIAERIIEFVRGWQADDMTIEQLRQRVDNAIAQFDPDKE